MFSYILFPFTWHWQFLKLDFSLGPFLLKRQRSLCLVHSFWFSVIMTCVSLTLFSWNAKSVHYPTKRKKYCFHKNGKRGWDRKWMVLSFGSKQGKSCPPWFFLQAKANVEDPNQFWVIQEKKSNSEALKANFPQSGYPRNDWWISSAMSRQGQAQRRRHFEKRLTDAVSSQGGALGQWRSISWKGQRGLAQSSWVTHGPVAKTWGRRP